MDAGNPLPIGGYASTATPTAVSADGDRVKAWFDLNGRQAIFDGGGLISVDDGAGSLTVDGTVTANLAAGTNNIGDVDVLTVNGVAPAFGSGVRGATVQRVTVATDDVVVVSQGTAANLNATVVGTGTFAVQNTAQASTNTQEMVGDVAHDAVAAGNPLLMGAYASAAAPTDVSADGDAVRVWALRSGAQVVQPTYAGVLQTTGNGASGTGVPRVTIANDSTGVLATVSTVTTVSTLTGGAVAHDAAISGNPHVIAGRAQDMDDTAPPNRVSAEDDTTRLAMDRDGAIFAHPHGPQVWSYHVDGSSALTDATVHAAPGAGLSLYVTDIIVSSGAATAMNVFFKEGATKVLGPWYLEAVAGRSMHIRFGTPKKVTANTALTVTTSAAIAHSVDVTGFTAQG